MEWALVATSAIDGPCNGILAASPEINDHIEDTGTCDDLLVFPNASFCGPGLYLWRGTLDAALHGEGGTWSLVEPKDLTRWIEHNGKDHDPA